MFYSKSLICNEEEAQDLEKIKKYLLELPSSERDYITISGIKSNTELDIERIGKLVDILVENKLLIPHFGVRCEACGMIIDDVYNPEDINFSKIYYCYNCNEDKKINRNDIICMFSINSLFDFFEQGQHIGSEDVAAQCDYTDLDKMDAVVRVCATISDYVQCMKDAEIRQQKEEDVQKKKKPFKILVKFLFASLSLLILMMLNKMVDFKENEYILTIATLFIGMFGDNVINSILE